MLTCVVPVARLHQSSAKEKLRVRLKPPSLQERRVQGGVRGGGTGNRMGVTQVVGWGDEVKEGGHVYTFLGTSVGKSWEIRDELVASDITDQG